MKSPENEKIFPDLVSNPLNYMESFAYNIRLMKKNKGLSLDKLSESCEISFDTLKNLTSGKMTDCKLSTAIKISKVFGISIDELVGCGTVNELANESMKMFRKLPKNEQNVIRWEIRTLNRIHSELPKGKILVSIMTPKCIHGNLEISKEWEHVDISDLPEDVKPKIQMGFRVPCVHYMPIYDNGDILLIAIDRKPANGEHCVVKIGKNLYITRCQRVGGELKFMSIINNKVKACEADVDELVGYVAEVIHEDE